MSVRSVDLVRDLVAIPSPSGNEQACAELVRDLFVRERIDVELVGSSVLARIVRGHGPRLLLNSHLDTVPVGEGWTRDPLEARWSDGRLYGRGANDAKASAAAQVCALIALAPRDDWQGELVLALTACEETTNAGMRDVLERIGMPDGSITGEPTGLEVVRAQGGLAIIAAEWRGRSCHAAHVGRVPNENALLRAALELGATAPFVAMPREHELLGRTTSVATVLRAGERSNVVPDRAEATFDARLTPLDAASDVLDELARRMPRAHLRIKSERLRPVETPESHPLVRAALAAADKPRAIGSNTLSDMALLGAAPCIKCGPGESARSHTPDEFVLASEVEAGERFYVRAAPAILAALAGIDAQRGSKVQR